MISFSEFVLLFFNLSDRSSNYFTMEQNSLSKEKSNIIGIMAQSDPMIRISNIIKTYRLHLLVFFFVFFIGLTFAHPAVLLNDEFITTNQLRQLHLGHQIIINEGKYGLGQNGTMSDYFATRSNVLGYSLFLPLISLPAFWIIDITGEQFAYFIIVLWMIIGITILLLIKKFFSVYSYVGNIQWTSFVFVMLLIIFFINLFYYSPFSVDLINHYPEILAIVLTNIILLSISATLIYEINCTIFSDSTFSFFGTMVCIFSSSYFLWSTHCKDHILVLACFVPIILCLIKFIKTDEYWYLPLAFLLTGTLAWARPEVALWTVIVVSGICVFTLYRYFFSPNPPRYLVYYVLCSPFFTLLGALPFFLNNYLLTKNILLPPESLYLSKNLTDSSAPSVFSLVIRFFPTIPSSPLNTISDIVGIFILPQSGNIGVIILVPLFFVMTIFGTIRFLLKRLFFSLYERKIFLILSIVSLAVFLSYFSQIHVMNADQGITPDIRYLSPIYFCLTLIGLIILKNSQIISIDYETLLKRLFIIILIGTPLSILILSSTYSQIFYDLGGGLTSLGKFFSYYVILLIIMTLIVLFIGLHQHTWESIYMYLIMLLCVVPFFWQINAYFFYRSFSGFAGYIFWIPAVRVVWDLIYLIMQNPSFQGIML